VIRLGVGCNVNSDGVGCNVKADGVGTAVKSFLVGSIVGVGVGLCVADTAYRHIIQIRINIVGILIMNMYLCIKDYNILLKSYLYINYNKYLYKYIISITYIIEKYYLLLKDYNHIFQRWIKMTPSNPIIGQNLVMLL
jgi:hypothetical protein